MAICGNYICLEKPSTCIFFEWKLGMGRPFRGHPIKIGKGNSEIPRQVARRTNPATQRAFKERLGLQAHHPVAKRDLLICPPNLVLMSWDGQNPGQWIQNIYQNIFFGVYVRYITYVCQLVLQILSTSLWCCVVTAGVKFRLGCSEIDSYPLFEQGLLHKNSALPTNMGILFYSQLPLVWRESRAMLGYRNVSKSGSSTTWSEVRLARPELPCSFALKRVLVLWAMCLCLFLKTWKV